MKNFDYITNPPLELITCPVIKSPPSPAKNKAHAADGGPTGPLRADPDLFRPGTITPLLLPASSEKNETKKAENLLIFPCQ